MSKYYVLLTDTDFKDDKGRRSKRIFHCDNYKEAKIVKERLEKYKSFKYIQITLHYPTSYRSRQLWIFEHTKDSDPVFYLPFDVKVIPSNPYFDDAKRDVT